MDICQLYDSKIFTFFLGFMVIYIYKYLQIINREINNEYSFYKKKKQKLYSLFRVF